MDVSIIVPCFNEVDNVPKLQREFFPVVAELAKARSVEVVFVDDGSADGTGDSLVQNFGISAPNEIPVRIERHLKNRGLGAALRTGFAAAQGDIMVTTDSDGTYQFADMPKLLAYLSSDVGVVTASPYHPDGGVAGVPGYRLILSKGSSLLYRLLVDPNVHTYTALFRAYRRVVVEQATSASDGFLAGTEILVKAILLGYRVAEYPAVLHSRDHGASKAKILRTIRAHLKFQWQIVLHRSGLKRLVTERSEISNKWIPSHMSSSKENQE